jgi:hypothetical protein
MISRAPAISGTTPAPGHRASSTVGKIAEQGPLRVAGEGVEIAGQATEEQVDRGVLQDVDEEEGE